MNVFRRPLSGEEQESDQKKMSFKKSDGKKGRISRWGFPIRPAMGAFSPSKTGYFLPGGNNEGAGSLC